MYPRLVTYAHTHAHTSWRTHFAFAQHRLSACVQDRVLMSGCRSPYCNSVGLLATAFQERQADQPHGFVPAVAYRISSAVCLFGALRSCVVCLLPLLVFRVSVHNVLVNIVPLLRSSCLSNVYLVAETCGGCFLVRSWIACFVLLAS